MGAGTKRQFSLRNRARSNSGSLWWYFKPSNDKTRGTSLAKSQAEGHRSPKCDLHRCSWHWHNQSWGLRAGSGAWHDVDHLKGRKRRWRFCILDNDRVRSLGQNISCGWRKSQFVGNLKTTIIKEIWDMWLRSQTSYLLTVVMNFFRFSCKSDLGIYAFLIMSLKTTAEIRKCCESDLQKPNMLI